LKRIVKEETNISIQAASRKQIKSGILLELNLYNVANKAQEKRKDSIKPFALFSKVEIILSSLNAVEFYTISTINAKIF
jgi:hypothetical protein